MNTNITNENEFILPELNDSFATDDFGDDFAGITPSFRRVKIPAGGALQFEIPSDDPQNPDYAKTLEAVILYSHPASAYWMPGSEFDENSMPLCASNDGIEGYGTPGGKCALCEFNRYNTAFDAKGNPTKGKACKNMRQLYLLCSGEYLPLQLTLPPTSLKAFGDFANVSFINRRRPTWASVVQIGLKRVENGTTPYSVATFRKLFDFTGEQLAKMKTLSVSFREQIHSMIESRPKIADSLIEADMPFGSGTYSGIIDGERDSLPQ